MTQFLRPSILPPQSTPLERGAEYAAARIDEIPTPLGSLWSIEDCPERLLPWLAWTVGVAEWDHDWPVETKRRVIAAAHEVHRKRGTPAAVKRLLDAIGAIYDYSEPAPLQYRVDIHNSEVLAVGDVQHLTAAVRRVDRLAARGTIAVSAGLLTPVAVAGGIGARTIVELGLPAEAVAA